MRALSLLQPWASLVILGLKTIETRSWDADERYAGVIAIHASKALKRDEVEIFHESPFLEAFAELGIDAISLLPRAAILGTVRLTGCHKVETFTKISARERAFGNYGNEEGQRWDWVLEDPKPLEVPIPARGMLGLWTVPPEMVARIQEMSA